MPDSPNVDSPAAQKLRSYRTDFTRPQTTPLFSSRQSAGPDLESVPFPSGVENEGAVQVIEHVRAHSVDPSLPSLADTSDELNIIFDWVFDGYARDRELQKMDLRVKSEETAAVTREFIDTYFHTHPLYTLNVQPELFQDSDTVEADFFLFDARLPLAGPNHSSGMYADQKRDMKFYAEESDQGRVRKAIGDLLPQVLALAFNFYGSQPDRLDAVYRLLLPTKFLAFLLCSTSVALVLGTPLDTSGVRLEALVLPLNFFVTVLIMAALHACVTCGYIGAQRQSRFNSSLYAKYFVSFAFYGDILLGQLLLASAAVFVAVVDVIATAQDDEDLLQTFRISGSIGCAIYSIFLCLSLPFTYRWRRTHNSKSI